MQELAARNALRIKQAIPSMPASTPTIAPIAPQLSHHSMPLIRMTRVSR